MYSVRYRASNLQDKDSLKKERQSRSLELRYLSRACCPQKMIMEGWRFPRGGRTGREEHGESRCNDKERTCICQQELQLNGPLLYVRRCAQRWLVLCGKSFRNLMNDTYYSSLVEEETESQTDEVP